MCLTCDVLGGVAGNGQHDEAQESLVHAPALAHCLNRAGQELCAVMGQQGGQQGRMVPA